MVTSHMCIDHSDVSAFLYLCVYMQLPLDTLVFMLNRFTADDFSKEGIPAGGHSIFC
jgi:hypothetical protein